MRGPLPDSIAMGYADWGECDAKIMTAAAHGVNVIVWFALSMTLDASGVPHIGGGPNLTCVAKTAADLNSQGLPTHHLISIGGWNGAHPDPAASADAWWGALSAYDTAAEAKRLEGLAALTQRQFRYLSRAGLGFIGLLGVAGLVWLNVWGLVILGGAGAIIWFMVFMPYMKRRMLNKASTLYTPTVAPTRK